MRLDVRVHELGLAESREQAKRLILAGEVLVDGQLVDRAAAKVSLEAQIEVRAKPPYVSRGGLKLEHALDVFGIEVAGLVVADLGASTGGFTDCMLQRGASRVYAVDVGYGQLDWKLRSDPRVVTMERINVRYLDPADVPERFDLITIDVSFISLKLILPVAGKLLKDDGKCLCLVKPQFEAGRSQVGKNGIVRDKNTHRSVLRAVVEYGNENGLGFAGLSYSPITGTKGNIEFLMLLKTGADGAEASEDVIEATVEQAHFELAR